jgi:hypothetical protein
MVMRSGPMTSLADPPGERPSAFPDDVSPVPSYPDEATRALSERIDAARTVLAVLRQRGSDTAPVEREIAGLRQQLRGAAR